MTDLEIIREMEKILNVPLPKIELREVDKYINYYFRGFSMNELGEITGLRLEDLFIKPVLKYIERLSRLSLLNIRYCHLEQNDIDFLHHLNELSCLNLRDNSSIRDYTLIGRLTGLKSLDLGYNNLSDASFLCELKGLTSLHMNWNNLTDVSFLQEFKWLKSLDLGYNNLMDASFLRELKELTSLHLNCNQLKDVSFITEIPHLTYLNIDGNPVENLPPEIANQGLNAIKNYFKSLQEGKKKQLNEVKILLVGDGGAGKTSLFKQLNREAFDKDESQTHGVNINTIDYTIIIYNKETVIKTHFWDFGGQEIMHASHQFFLSERSLYILVLDGRKDEKTEYWLKHIESFGGNSRVMVVLNKIDENPAFDLDQYTLKQKYKNILGFYPVSCKTGKGLDDFKKVLTDAIPKIELLQTEVAESWLNVKEKLETVTVKNNYIDQREFESICIQEKIDDESTRTTLINFLNELGIVLHFEKLELSNLHVLNPRWVTEAVYKIINSPYLAEQKGILDTKQLDYILNKEKSKTGRYEQKLRDITYRCDEQSYIISLMGNFELCYRLPGDKILIPDLLEKKTPGFNIDETGALRYIVQYDFLPSNIISRFIVRMHRDIKDDLRWRTGVVLEDPELKTTALVKSDETDKTISIMVSGKQKRDDLSIIRKTIREINGSFKKLDVKELVPLPDSHEYVDYLELIGLERMGILEYVSGRLLKKYSVKRLLDGIESEWEREEYHSKNERGNNYYYVDKMYQDNKEVQDMSNQSSINITNSTVSGNVVGVAEKIGNISNKVEASTAPDELKTLLKDLSEEIEKIAGEMNKTLDKEQVENILDDLRTLANEAVKQKPRKSIWEVTANGLKDALLTLVSVASPVLSNLDKITNFLSKISG